MAAALSRRTRVALTAGLTTLIVLAGTTASWALWTASAALSSSAGGATVEVTHALSGSTLAVTYNSSTSVAVGTVRVTNAGSRAGTYSLAVSATSASSTLRSAVDVEIGTAASCTTTATLSGVQSGTFAATVTKTGSLAAGAFIDLCVRTTLPSADRAANASTSLAATVNSSIAVGTWSDTASPAITFTQSVAAATASIDPAAWYWIGSTLNTALCAEGKYSGTGAGTEIVQDNCTAPTGSAANELFKFTPTTGGYYRIVYKNAPTLAIGTSNGNGQPITLTAATGSLVEWSVTLNSDSTITLTNRSSSRCMAVPGSSTAALVTLQSQNCGGGGGANMKFTLTMFKVATPAPVALSCSADGYNAYYSWPALTGYEGDVAYRVFIGGILVTPHSRGTGWDTTVQFGNGGITVGTYGSGTKTVLVEQSVSGAAWTTTGTGSLKIAAAAPFLLCG